jgi:outer membrane cobalamin receptor
MQGIAFVDRGCLEDLEDRKGTSRIDFVNRSGIFLSPDPLNISILLWKEGTEKMKKWLLLSAVIGVWICPKFSLANEANMEERTFILEDTVVTATKTEESRSDIPNSIILMDETDIEESPSGSLGGLLANELGIDWRTYGGFGGASHGIHIRGMGADGTQVFVNGVNVNSPSLGQADVARIPLNNIERIEVVKGSGSLLYGTGAMGGTVSIITKRPERDEVDLQVDAGFGSERAYKISVEHGMFLSDEFGYYFTLGHRETDGFRDNSDLTHTDVSLKLVYEKLNIWNISLYGDYIDREYGRPGVKPPPGTENFFVNGVQVYSSDAASMLDKGGDEDTHLVLEVKGSPSEKLDLNVRADYARMKAYNLIRYYDSFSESVPGSKSWTTNEASTIEGNMDFNPYEGLNFFLGADYRDYDWENESVDLNGDGSENAGMREKTSAQLDTSGLYAEAKYRPCDYFRFMAGVRREDHSTFGTETISRYGFTVNASEDTVFKFSRGKHFKAPTLNDLFYPHEDWGWGMGASGNQNLRPETGYHTDVTFEQTLFDDKAFLTFSYFDWDINDKIRWIPDESYFYRPQNLDRYEADGWELGTKIGPFYNIVLALSYTSTDAEEDLQDGVKRQALYTPDSQFKGDLKYWTESGFSASTTIRYVSDRPGNYASNGDVNPSKTLDNYWTTDVKIEQRIYEHWVFSLQCNNLFDKEYDTYFSSFYNSTGTSVIAGYPGGGRSVLFNVSYVY